MALSDQDKADVSAMLAQAMAMQAAQPPAMIPAASMAPPQPVATMMPAAAMGCPTPTGVSFRIAVTLADGSEAPAYLHFGPEVLPNLPAVVQQLATIYPLSIYPSRRQGWSNGGGNGGWNNNNGGRYGRGGRRW